MLESSKGPHAPALVAPEVNEVLLEYSKELIDNSEFLAKLLTNSFVGKDLKQQADVVLQRLKDAGLVEIHEGEEVLPLFQTKYGGYVVENGEYVRTGTYTNSILLISALCKRLVEMLLAELEPERVLIKSGTTGAVICEGTYAGSEMMRFEVSMDAETQKLLGDSYVVGQTIEQSIPRLLGDDGKLYLGCECYWNPLSYRVPRYHPAFNPEQTVDGSS